VSVAPSVLLSENLDNKALSDVFSGKLLINKKKHDEMIKVVSSNVQMFLKENNNQYPGKRSLKNIILSIM
jgi:hypothetical protein